MDTSFLDALVFPDDPSTPTSPTFFNPFTNAASSSSSSAPSTSSASNTVLDDSAASSSTLDFNNLHDPWEGFPAGDYADYDPVSYGGAGGGMMGLDLGGMAGASNGVELMDIAPLPALIHSLPLHHSYHTSNTPSYCPSASFNPDTHYSHQQPQSTSDDPSPSPSSHYSSLPRTPPSLILHASSSGSSSANNTNKRARRESSVNPYASTTAGSSYAGSPEPESFRVLGDDDEQDAKKGGAGAGEAPNGKGKKRKQLPTTAEFQHPDVSGLSKKEARLVKNRAAAFLSRQRKREQFDELEIQCNALVVENGQLKFLLAKSTSTSASALPPKLSKRQAAAAAAAAAQAALVPQVDQAQVAALQSDLANLRTLLHASTAREAALEVEMASLRAQLGPGAKGGKVGGSLSPMLSGGLIQDMEDAVAGGVSAQAEEAGVTVGGRRGTVGRRERDREGKRVGGVALMVILFSFALFTLPPGTISNLPLRSPTASSFPFSSLGRVLQPGGPGAGFPTAIERQVLNKDDSTTSDVEMGVCEMEDSSHGNGTESSSSNRKEECLAEEKRRSELPSDASTIPKDLSHWNYPSSLDVASPSSSSLDSINRRSFSLTLLRPIPSSPASLHLTSQTDGVDDVLERWLGLSLFDQASSGPSPVGSNSPQDDNEPGWFVVDSSASPFVTNFVQQQQQEEQEKSNSDVVEETKAWDGTPLERMELDEVVLGLSSSSSSSPSSPSSSSDKAPPPSSPSPRIPHSYLSLPPAEGTNDTFVRVDLELEVGLRRREVAIVGREEVGRLMMKSAGSGGSGLGGLPGGWVN